MITPGRGGGVRKTYKKKFYGYQIVIGLSLKCMGFISVGYDFMAKIIFCI